MLIPVVTYDYPTSTVKSVAYDAAVMASSPRAYWKCDDQRTLPRDYSGNNFHIRAITASSATDAVTMEPTGALWGTPCWAMQRDQAFCTFGTTTIVSSSANPTYEMWFKMSTTPSADMYLCQNGTGNQVTMFIGNTGIIKVTVQGVAVLGNGVANVCNNQWRHLVVTREGTTWKYYVDGASDNASAGTSTPLTPSGYFGFGTPANATAATLFISRLAYYEAALSAATVAAHYAAAF